MTTLKLFNAIALNILAQTLFVLCVKFEGGKCPLAPETDCNEEDHKDSAKLPGGRLPSDGISAATLALAIALPVGCLGACCLALCYWQRKKRNRTVGIAEGRQQWDNMTESTHRSEHWAHGTQWGSHPAPQDPHLTVSPPMTDIELGTDLERDHCTLATLSSPTREDSSCTLTQETHTTQALAVERPPTPQTHEPRSPTPPPPYTLESYDFPEHRTDNQFPRCEVLTQHTYGREPPLTVS